MDAARLVARAGVARTCPILPEPARGAAVPAGSRAAPGPGRQLGARLELGAHVLDDAGRPRRPRRRSGRRPGRRRTRGRPCRARPRALGLGVERAEQADLGALLLGAGEPRRARAGARRRRPGRGRSVEPGRARTGGRRGRRRRSPRGRCGAAPPGCAGRPDCRPPTSRARRVDDDGVAEPGVLERLAQEELAHRRAADVAGADDGDAVRGGARAHAPIEPSPSPITAAGAARAPAANAYIPAQSQARTGTSAGSGGGGVTPARSFGAAPRPRRGRP